MPDYMEMYKILFRETTKVISALQKAQRQTEELYISDDNDDNIDTLIEIKRDNELDKVDNSKQPPKG